MDYKRQCSTLFLRDELTLLSLPSFVVYNIGIVNTSIHEFCLVPSCCYIERSQMLSCSPEQRNMISKLCCYYSESSAPGVPLDMVYVHLSSTFAMACAGCGFRLLHSKDSLVLKPASGVPSAVIMELQPWSNCGRQDTNQVFCALPD